MPLNDRTSKTEMPLGSGDHGTAWHSGKGEHGLHFPIGIPRIFVHVHLMQHTRDSVEANQNYDVDSSEGGNKYWIACHTNTEQDNAAPSAQEPEFHLYDNTVRVFLEHCIRQRPEDRKSTTRDVGIGQTSALCVNEVLREKEYLPRKQRLPSAATDAGAFKWTQL
ncbi:hypothetical protein CAPTEDRAFT_209039 [Capitella teleta]|uniref:Uncharacterized protein n=1 Tax=Capitella teleta TaxID=283909 RepID=R7THJ3_CAPTE|nr:hypothetical protein CAPTEDRAFT_209039 [Capitella teleta]|eukprot:ELT93273.1 hypothetical protein CAPTEDRAFT_209039 [Capitella teleta]